MSFLKPGNTLLPKGMPRQGFSPTQETTQRLDTFSSHPSPQGEKQEQPAEHFHWKWHYVQGSSYL